MKANIRYKFLSCTLLCVFSFPCLANHFKTKENIQAILAVAQTYKSNKSEQVLKHGLTPWSHKEYQQLKLEKLFKHGDDKTAPKLKDEQTGLLSVVHWKDDKTILIAFGGFDASNLVGWWKNITTSAVVYLRNTLSKMDLQALEIVRAIKKSHPEKEIILTGHSLGTRPSQYAALIEDLKSINFAPLGLNVDERKSIYSNLKNVVDFNQRAKKNLIYLIGEYDLFCTSENYKTQRKWVATSYLVASSFVFTTIPQYANLFVISTLLPSYALTQKEELLNKNNITIIPKAGHSLYSLRNAIAKKK